MITHRVACPEWHNGDAWLGGNGVSPRKGRSCPGIAPVFSMPACAGTLRRGPSSPAPRIVMPGSGPWTATGQSDWLTEACATADDRLDELGMVGEPLLQARDFPNQTYPVKMCRPETTIGSRAVRRADVRDLSHHVRDFGPSPAG